MFPVIVLVRFRQFRHDVFVQLRGSAPPWIARRTQLPQPIYAVTPGYFPQLSFGEVA